MSCLTNCGENEAFIWAQTRSGSRPCTEEHCCRGPRGVPRKCGRDFTEFSDCEPDCYYTLRCCRKCVVKRRWEAGENFCECDRPDRSERDYTRLFSIDLLPGNKHHKYNTYKAKYCMKVSYEGDQNSSGICKNIQIAEGETIRFKLSCTEDQFGVWRDRNLIGIRVGEYRNGYYTIVGGKKGERYWYGHPGCLHSGACIRVY